jgi:hypothetical protein
MEEELLQQLSKMEDKARFWKSISIALIVLILLIAFVSYFPTHETVLPWAN